MSYLIDGRARNVLNRMQTPKGGQHPALVVTAIDPTIVTTILAAIGSVIVQVIQAVAQCKPPTPKQSETKGGVQQDATADYQSVSVVQNPSMAQTVRLGLMCRTALWKEGIVPWGLAPSMRDALIAEGKSVTTMELSGMTVEAMSAMAGGQQDEMES